MSVNRKVTVPPGRVTPLPYKGEKPPGNLFIHKESPSETGLWYFCWYPYLSAEGLFHRLGHAHALEGTLVGLGRQSREKQALPPAPTTQDGWSACRLPSASGS